MATSTDRRKKPHRFPHHLGAGDPMLTAKDAWAWVASHCGYCPMVAITPPPLTGGTWLIDVYWRTLDNYLGYDAHLYPENQHILDGNLEILARQGQTKDIS